MKKSILLLIFVLFFLVLPQNKIYAQTSSCCSANGGIYGCNTVTSELYCKDGTISRECTCKASSPTPTPTPSPTPIPTSTPVFSPIPTPVCIAFSTYDQSLKMCKCNDGYTVNENKCITYKEYCIDKFGGNSIYDKEKNSCGCSSDYVWNIEGNKCISFNEFCQKKLGSKSYYDSEYNSCSCFQGYSIQDNNCKLIPTNIPSPQVTTSVKITSIPNPTTNITKIPVKNITSTISPSKNSDLIVKNGNEKAFVVEKKQNYNPISQFLKKLFNLLTALI